MTAITQEILKTFDELPDSDQIEVALAILKRIIHFDFSPLDDEDLVLNAEELFLELDQQEFRTMSNPARGEVWLVG